MDLIVVDGPNLYNRVCEHLAGLGEPERALEYLKDYFDIDRLIAASLGSIANKLGVIIFHSNKQLGEKAFRLTGPETEAFWTRQGLNPDASTSLVVIPGATSAAEKGVDTAVTTYLYETVDHWQSCCIVSDDADFVPPVQALRRRGKIVFALVSGKRDDDALARATQRAYRIDGEFLHADFYLSTMYARGGRLDEMLSKQLSGASKVLIRDARSSLLFGRGSGGLLASGRLLDSDDNGHADHLAVVDVLCPEGSTVANEILAAVRAVLHVPGRQPAWLNISQTADASDGKVAGFVTARTWVGGTRLATAGAYRRRALVDQAAWVQASATKVEA